MPQAHIGDDDDSASPALPIEVRGFQRSRGWPMRSPGSKVASSGFSLQGIELGGISVPGDPNTRC